MTSTCGYTEGQVLSSKPAYGGSNYVNEDCVQIFESMSGNNRGDGSVEIRSQMVGYQETSHLNVLWQQIVHCRIKYRRSDL